MIEATEAITVAAPVVSALFLYIFIKYGPDKFGSDADWWNWIRRTLLPPLNRVARKNGWGKAAYSLEYDEFIGNVDKSVDEVNDKLEQLGCYRNPFSAYKWTPDGRAEMASWSYRTEKLSKLQLHIILFEGRDGGTDVYAHIEYNAIHPLYGAKHYFAVDYTELGSTISAEELFYIPMTETWNIAEDRWQSQN